MTSPRDIVSAARAYLGTRWRHQGRTSHALDCIGLLVRVAHDLGLSDADQAGYSRRPHGGELEHALHMHCAPIASPDVGCVALMRFEHGAPQHVGVLGDYPHGGLSLIHAYAPSRKVVEHRLDDSWRLRIVQCFDLPGVTRGA